MMKKYILLGILATSVLGAMDTSAHGRHYFGESRRYYARHAESEESSSDKSSNATDKEFDCYRAWKKDLKREKKEYKSKIKEFQDRPLAADRKLRKAYKKAWKADILEKEHKTGHDHEYERGFWWY